MTKKAILTLALTSCTIGILTTSCENQEQTAQTSAQQAPTVTVFPIQEQQVSDFGEWFGYLRGLDSTSIKPQVSGFLETQHYKNGARVKAGDVLFSIDSKIYMAQLKQAEANLLVARAKRAAAEASVQQAQLDVNRFTQLIRQNAISEKELDDARQVLRSAEVQVQMEQASIEQMEAAVERAQINVDYTTIRAPYDGVVGTADVSQGALVTPATTLTSIVSIDPIRVDFAVSSNRILDALNYGEINSRKLPVSLILENGKEYPLKGDLTALDSKIDSNGLIAITAEFANPDNILRPGMAVRVKIPLNLKTVMLVPADSIQSVLRTSYLIALDKDGKPKMITVKPIGNYPIAVKEASGYESTQELVAVEGVLAPLAEQFKALGYDKATDTPIVCDKANALYANRVTGSNSRLSDPSKAQRLVTSPFTFAPKTPAAAAAQAGPEKKPLDAKNAKPTLPPFLVSTTPLIQRDVATQAEWFGSLRGVEETEIRAQVSGFLLKQNFKNGDIVQKDQLLFTIDPAPYKATVREATANLHIAEAALKQAKVALDMNSENLKRYAKLNAQSPGAVMDKTITDTETLVIRNKADILRAQATIEQMIALLHQAEINLGYTEIRAPFTGRAGIANPSIGDLVSPSSPQALVTLSSVNPMRVDFQISGKLALKGYTESQHKTVADAKIPFHIILENGTPYPEAGVVTSVDNKLSRTTGTLSVVGRVQNEKGVLHSGMPVRIRVDDEVMQGAYLVPTQALVSFEGIDMIVFILPNGAPMPMPVIKGKVVNLPTVDTTGQTVLAPMQVVSINRAAVIPQILMKTKAPSLEALIFGKMEVSSWKELLLKQAEASDIRALMEKNGKLPDDLPAKEGVASWDELFLKKNEAKDFRDFLFKQAKAEDELDVMAHGAGVSGPMELFLKEEGIPSLADSRVVVEGAINAMRVFGANKPYGEALVNKLTIKPYVYSRPMTVEPSITATKDQVKAPASPQPEPKPQTPSNEAQD